MVPNKSKRRILAKTFDGVRTSLEIENWVTEHIENLLLCEKHEDVLTEIWPIMADNIRNNTFRKCDPQEVLKEVAFEWIRGKPYVELFQILLDNNAKRIAGTKKLKFKIDHVVEICENAFAFDGTLILGAIAEIVKLIRPDGSIDLVQMITELQKKLRYGLESITAITLYELGFADRVVSSDMSSTFNVELADKNKVILNMIQRRSQLANLLRKYPAYFTERFNDIF